MKYSLKTLPASKEFCLNHLGAILDKFSGRLLVRELASIGKILNAKSFEEVNAELIGKYASEPMKIDLKIDAASNRNVLLFNQSALKLLPRKTKRVMAGLFGAIYYATTFILGICLSTRLISISYKWVKSGFLSN